MKSYLKLILPLAVVAFAVSVYFFNSVKLSSRTSDLFLQNVEALASDEASNITCLGTGSLDCPRDRSKVKKTNRSLTGGGEGGSAFYYALPQNSF